jgi:hypothetical protein
MRTPIRPVIASAAFAMLTGLVCAIPHLFRADGLYLGRRLLVLSLPIIAAILVHVPRLGAHVASRAVAWIAIAVGVILAVLPARGDAVRGCSGLVAMLGATIIVALGTARFEADAERAGFTPIGFRGGFLAASSAAFAISLITALMSLACATYDDSSGLDAITGALSLALLVTTVLVLRMRAIGIHLGRVTAAVAAVVFVAVRPASFARPTPEGWAAIACALIAMSAVAFSLPILWSRFRPVAIGRATERRSPWTSVIAVAIAALTALAQWHYA